MEPESSPGGRPGGRRPRVRRLTPKPKPSPRGKQYSDGTTKPARDLPCRQPARTTQAQDSLPSDVRVRGRPSREPEFARGGQEAEMNIARLAPDGRSLSASGGWAFQVSSPVAPKGIGSGDLRLRGERNLHSQSKQSLSACHSTLSRLWVQWCCAKPSSASRSSWSAPSCPS